MVYYIDVETGRIVAEHLITNPTGYQKIEIWNFYHPINTTAKDL